MRIKTILLVCGLIILFALPVVFRGGMQQKWLHTKREKD